MIGDTSPPTPLSNLKSEISDPAPAFPAATRRTTQRARLARLREAAEPLIDEERRTALRALLQNPLLIPDGPTSIAFALVRRHREWLADWFAHYADWSLVVTAEAARLRKIPADPTDSTRPALEPRSGEPFTRSRYVLFCLALAALERGDRQITLGRLAEHLAIALAADPAFAAAGFLWSLDHLPGRRDFVHTLRLLVSLGVLRRVQGDEEKLLHDRQTDALYNVSRPVLGLLLTARRSPSLVTATDFPARLAALLEAEHPDTPDARNRALRTRFVRLLLDDPVLYYDTLDPEARAYLDRQRAFLLPELAAATGLEPEIRLEGLALTDPDGDCTDSGLPEEGTEGHLTLLLATWLADRLRTGDTAPVSLAALRSQTAKFIRQHRHHWRREVAERGAEIGLTELVLARLAGLALIVRTADGAIHARSALGRFALRSTADLAPAEDTGEFPFTP
jgi:uncharacterized protein (TIGR02678 family)